MNRRRRAFTLVELPAVSRRKGKAFTLVELLVVVAIIALLVTILMPSLGRALELTRRTVCQTQLHALGRAWQIYFQDNNNGIPKMFAVRDSQWDFMTQFDFLIWSQNGGPDWINSGVLYGQKLIGDEDNYVCPTIRKNSGGRWFTNLQDENGSYHNQYVNPWPPHRRDRHTTTTYGRRRTNYYDDESWSQLPDPDDRRNKQIILSMSGATAVSKPGDFSFMADGFHRPDIALLSHVPNINVLYLDGHVDMYEDVDGNVLYDNDVTDWSQGNNWILDDIWMIIDGYHKPPAGQ